MRRVTALLTAVVLALAGVVVVASPAAAATVTVTSSADAGPGSLREAVAAAAPGDTIEFDASVTTIVLLTALTLPQSVIIDGGGDVTISRGPGTSFTQFRLHPDNADQDYVIRNITLAGVAGSTGMALNASYGPTNELARDITLSNVTVRNQTNVYGPVGEFFLTRGDVLVENSLFEDNVATNPNAQGGLYLNGVAGASIRIVDSTFRRNTTTTGDGGAITLANMSFPTVEIVRSTFEENTAGRDGGAVFAGAVAGAITVSESTFRDNAAQNGGAIRHISGGLMTVTDSTFDDNTATADGGAIADALASLTVSSTTFEGNSAGNGGAIATNSGSTITASTFAANSAFEGAGVSVSNAATFTLSVSTFRANAFGSAGGGLSVAGVVGSITIDSTTFSGHVHTGGGTPNGAAVYVAAPMTVGESFTLVNSTIDENLATGTALFLAGVSGGGDLGIRSSTFRGASLAIVGISNATVVLENSIFEALDPADDPIVTTLGGGGALDISYSILSGALPAGATDGGGNLVDTDPQLGTLADNGGLTQTRLPQPGSPAIDAGNPAFAPPPAVDQRGTGFARVTYGRLDIGAVEVQAQMHPATGGVVSWWLLPVAGGVLLLGIGGILLARRGHGAKHSAR